MNSAKAKALWKLAHDHALNYRWLKRLAASWHKHLDLVEMRKDIVRDLGDMKRRALAILDAEAAQQERSAKRHAYRMRRRGSRR